MTDKDTYKLIMDLADAIARVQYPQPKPKPIDWIYSPSVDYGRLDPLGALD